jgi:hypothetical protein
VSETSCRVPTINSNSSFPHPQLDSTHTHTSLSRRRRLRCAGHPKERERATKKREQSKTTLDDETLSLHSLPNARESSQTNSLHAIDEPAHIITIAIMPARYSRSAPITRRLLVAAAALAAATLLVLLAAAPADAARPPLASRARALLAASSSPSSSSSSPPSTPATFAKKHHDDDDPAPSPDPDDDDDAIAQMKKCHAAAKGKEACLDVPGGHCEYCESSSALPLPDVCVHELEAKLMPGFMWECSAPEDKQEEEAAAAAETAVAANGSGEDNGDPCEGLPEPSCAATVGVCVWCVAAAVPSACFTVAQAAVLPSGVFTCGAAPSASASLSLAAPAVAAS